MLLLYKIHLVSRRELQVFLLCAGIRALSSDSLLAAAMEEAVAALLLSHNHDIIQWHGQDIIIELYAALLRPFQGESRWRRCREHFLIELLFQSNIQMHSDYAETKVCIARQTTWIYICIVANFFVFNPCGKTAYIVVQNFMLKWHKGRCKCKLRMLLWDVFFVSCLSV